MSEEVVSAAFAADPQARHRGHHRPGGPADEDGARPGFELTLFEKRIQGVAVRLRRTRSTTSRGILDLYRAGQGQAGRADHHPVHPRPGQPGLRGHDGGPQHPRRHHPRALSTRPGGYAPRTLFGAASWGRRPRGLDFAFPHGEEAALVSDPPHTGYWLGVHHIALTIPPGAEAQVRAFYGDLLGMTEVDAPDADAGGCHFRSGDLEFDFDVEAGTRTPRRAHPGTLVADIDALAARLTAAGHPHRVGPQVPRLPPLLHPRPARQPAGVPPAAPGHLAASPLAGGTVSERCASVRAERLAAEVWRGTRRRERAAWRARG